MMQSWDDLRYFLALQRHGKLVAAGRALNVDYTTVGRRVKALESLLNEQLFEKKEYGFEVTAAGESLVPHAENIEKTVLGIEGSISSNDDAVRGLVRISAPEYFGTYFLSANLPSMLAVYPQLEIDLSFDKYESDFPKREVDILITVDKPSSKRLVSVPLVEYHLGLFASKNYFNNHSIINDESDFINHKLIGAAYDDHVSRIIMSSSLRKFQSMPFRSHSLIAQYKSIQNGAGLGLLPTHVECECTDIVRVMRDKISIKQTLWMVTSADAQCVDGINKTCKTIVSLVDENKLLFK